jgi:hypothetical protein
LPESSTDSPPAATQKRHAVNGAFFIFRHRAKIQADLIPQMGKEIFLLDLPFTPLYKKWHSYNGILKP